MSKRVLLAGLMAFAPVAGSAQTAPPPPSAATADDIVVRARTEAERKAIQSYVANISVRSESQLPRFHDPVCPLAIGFDRQFAAIVEKRIRDVARAAGVDVAKKERCPANLILIMAENGSKLVKDIRVHRADWLGELDPSDIDALIAPAPARAWSVTTLRNEDGGRQRGMFITVMTASILKVPTRQDMEVSFVIVDKAPSMGMTLRQVADYAAMRGLARTRPPAPGGAIDTILTAFDKAATPVRELTASDAAYLRALYSTQGMMDAVTERNAITRRIAKGK
jgi:hypothetical protein